MATPRTQFPTGSDASFDWKGELKRGLEKFVWISPISSLQQANQGDVLLSSSGNMRLLLAVNEQNKDARLTFLTRLESGKLRLESAMRSKIDKNRVDNSNGQAATQQQPSRRAAAASAGCADGRRRGPSRGRR